MIKNALSALPARPVLFIVPLLVVGVLSFYYWGQYTSCSSDRQFRSALNETLRSAEASAKFRLAAFTHFAWDRVRIVSGFQADRSNTECPFGWDWAAGERESLMASGLLTVMLFAEQGAIVRYQELRGDEVEFRGVDAGLTPQAAVFTRTADTADHRGVTLTLDQ